MEEYVYVAVNDKDEVQWIRGSSSKTRYFKTDKYLKQAVEYNNKYHPDKPLFIKKCKLVPVEGE